jgi:hypothetical protein
MNSKLVLAVLAIGLIPAHAIAGKISALEIEKREGRSVAAFQIFREACFASLQDLPGRQQFLEQNYFPASENRTKEKLAFVQAKDGGTVWNTSRSETENVTVVAENSGKCHVIVEAASAEKLQKAMKDLALDTKDSMTFSVVDYKGVTPDVPVQTSKFDVKDPDGAVYFSVYTSTKINPENESAAGIISMTAPSRK